jgi:hypothetical protein
MNNDFRKSEVQHLPSDYNDAPTVDELINHLGKQTGFRLEAEEEGDRSRRKRYLITPLAQFARDGELRRPLCLVTAGLSI